MKEFAFILLIISVSSAFVNEKIPLNIYISKVRKELKSISALHSIEELTYSDYDVTIDEIKYTLSSVKAKAIFFNSFMPVASVVNQSDLTIEFNYKLPEGATISPYHSIYTANLTSNESNEKSYPIEFEIESDNFKFTKSYELYEKDNFYVPKGSSEINFVSLKAKNLDTNSPYAEELIKNITNQFLSNYTETMNKEFNKAVAGYYKSLPLEELGQKIYVQNSGISEEVYFDLTLEDMPYYQDVAETEGFVILERKGTLNEENKEERYIPENADNKQRFNLHSDIYQKLISQNLFGFDFEQSNNPATLYQLTVAYLKKVAKLDGKLPDETKLKIEAQMFNASFDNPSPMVGDVKMIISVISQEEQNTIFEFNAAFKFTFLPTLFQSGLNFVLLGKNVELYEINPESGYEILDYDLLLQWIQNTYLCALGKNEYNLFEVPLDLSYYFKSNDLSWEYLDDGYLSIKKN